MIIVEDGSIVAGANSYVTVLDLDSFASLRGYTLPAIEADKEILLIKSMDYLNSLNYKGSRVSSSQSLPFPRSNIYLDGELLPSNSIPTNLKNAQMQAAIELQTQEIQQNAGKGISMEKVDVIEVQYEKGGSTQSTYFAKVAGFLYGLTNSKLELGLFR
jgi:hypothetical protein